MQYSTIFTDEGTKVGGAVGAAEKTTDGEKGVGGKGEGERERERLGLLPRLNIGTPTASSFAHFLSIFFPMFVLRLAPSHYFSHSLGGSYLTTVICISILLKKISNKVSQAAPS